MTDILLVQRAFTHQVKNRWKTVVNKVVKNTYVDIYFLQHTYLLIMAG